MLLPLFASVAFAAWTSPSPDVRVAEVLAACRAAATLVGPGGATRDPRLVDACAEAHGLVRGDAGPGWASLGGPSSPSGAAARWEACLHTATFVDASGWPRIHSGRAEACMTEAGLVRAERAPLAIARR